MLSKKNQKPNKQQPEKQKTHNQMPRSILS